VGLLRLTQCCTMENAEAVEGADDSRATTESFLNLVDSLEFEITKVFAPLKELKGELSKGENPDLIRTTAQEFVETLDDAFIAAKDRLYGFLGTLQPAPPTEEGSSPPGDFNLESFISTLDKSSSEVPLEEAENPASDRSEEVEEVHQSEESPEVIEEPVKEKESEESPVVIEDSPVKEEDEEEIVELDNENSPKEAVDSDIELIEELTIVNKKEKGGKKKKNESKKRKDKERVENMAKKRRTIESSSDEEMRNGNASDGDVISDEDLELAAQIKKERDAKRASKRPPKKEKEGKKGKGEKKKTKEAEDAKALRKAKKALAESDDEEEEVEESEKE
ncbi:hypothetical protein PFISCL1PPCAC_20500, partial [Pristionchus fissidentatus]